MQDYYMDGVKLSTIEEEKDLGVLIIDDLKPSVQYALKLLEKLYVCFKMV